MVDTSWANLVISYELTNILLKLMGCTELLNFAQSYYIKT